MPQFISKRPRLWGKAEAWGWKKSSAVWLIEIGDGNYVSLYMFLVVLFPFVMLKVIIFIVASIFV